MERRSLSTFSLVAMGVGAIMGSGWMFAAQYTTQTAGPASFFSWIIGALLMLFIALVFAEVCTIVPVEGSTSRIPHITHGTLTSYIFAWITWISYLVLAPIEVQAVIQYLAVFYPDLINASKEGALSIVGFPVAALMLLGFCIINFYSLKWLAKINNVITLFKVLVPVFISIVFIVFCFTLPALKDIKAEPIEMIPFGFDGVLAAVSVGGIAYAFTGFKTIVELAGSTKNPKKSIPFATIGAILICLVVFLFLQFAYLLVMSKYVHGNNWDTITISGEATSSFGPFAVMAQHFGEKWVMYPLYFGAIVFPLMAGLIYFSIAQKSLGAMVANGYLPNILGKLTPITKKPVYAIGFNFLIALVMFAPFPGWQEMATFLTSLIALTYVTGSTSTMALRHHLPDIHRPFRLKFAYLICTLGIFAASLVFLWSGWVIISKAGVALIIAIVMLGAYRIFRHDKSEDIHWNFRESIWFWFYIVAVTLVSYFSTFGGTGLLNFYYSTLALLVISFITITIAKYLCLSGDEMLEGIKQAISNDNYV
ncbi:APC family permease [Pseudofrancisella aestuarii]|uniref:APC family permease n=1 Tax=Pseudofrancisella aestuarii TaxID=2670347 RepID=A0ABV9TDA5_9GAMM|nr:APC family permease [Pseudofrancisella aestuarii]